MLLNCEVCYFIASVKVKKKGKLLFTEIAHSLKKISSECKSSNVKPQCFLNDFSSIEEMLNQERSEFEVIFLSLSSVLWNSLEL